MKENIDTQTRMECSRIAEECSRIAGECSLIARQELTGGEERNFEYLVYEAKVRE